MHHEMQYFADNAYGANTDTANVVSVAAFASTQADAQSKPGFTLFGCKYQAASMPRADHLGIRRHQMPKQIRLRLS